MARGNTRGNRAGTSSTNASEDNAAVVMTLREMIVVQQRQLTAQREQMTLQKEQLAAQQQRMEQQQQQIDNQRQSQQEQTTLLRDGLLAVQQASTAALEKVVSSRERRPGNFSDFRKLQPPIFTGTEKPLEAEQWITDMTNLLGAAKIPPADQVNVVKIQLTDVART